MFLRHTTRKKNGKQHRYWSIVENRRLSGGRVVQRPVLYLGEINSSQERAWRKSIEVLDDGALDPTADVGPVPRGPLRGVAPDESIVRLRLRELRLLRPRQWGACWLALKLWRELGWTGSGPNGCRRAARVRAGIRCCSSSVAYRLMAPGQRMASAPEWFEERAGRSFGRGLRACRRSTSSTAATIGCSSTSRRCSTIWSVAGATCSTSASTCCSTT